MNFSHTRCQVKKSSGVKSSDVSKMPAKWCWRELRGPNDLHMSPVAAENPGKAHTGWFQTTQHSANAGDVQLTNSHVETYIDVTVAIGHRVAML